MSRSALALGQSQGNLAFSYWLKDLIPIRINICSCSSIVKSAGALILMEFLWSFGPRKVYFAQSLFHPKSQLYGYSCGTIKKGHFEHIVSYLVSYFCLFMQTRQLLEQLVLPPVFLEGQFVIQLLCSAHIQDSLSCQLYPIMKFPLTWTRSVPRQILLCLHIYYHITLWWFPQKCKNWCELAEDKDK